MLDVGVEVTIGVGLLLTLLQSKLPLEVGRAVDLTAVVLLEVGTHLEYSCSECGGFV